MGNGRFEILCFDGKNRMGIVAGNMRKRVWVNKDDIILFSKWEFTTDDDKCSIVHKYDIDESRKLQKEGEFPDTINLDEENEFGDDDNFQFDYDAVDSSSDEETNDKKKEDNKWWSKDDKNKEDDLDVWNSEKIDLDDI